MPRRKNFQVGTNPQNASNLLTMKRMIASIVPGTDAFNELINYKLPLLLKNGLITESDYHLFIGKLNRNGDFSRVLLIGKTSKNRKEAICTGIIQATIDAHKTVDIVDLGGIKKQVKKPYTDSWSAECYLRAAITMGFLKWSRDTDEVSVTDNGKKFAMLESGSAEETAFLVPIVMSNPIAVRILSLTNGNPLTKFELGTLISFNNECGHTTRPLNEHIAEVCTSSKAEKHKLVQNDEGSSDKYARTVASWLIQLGLLKRIKKTVTTEYEGETYSKKMTAYVATLEGKRALRTYNSTGNSSHPSVPKKIAFAMLASKDNTVRLRRAKEIGALLKKDLTYQDIVTCLSNENITASIDEVKNDIVCLINLGLNINVANDTVSLRDRITGLEIPVEKPRSKKAEDVKESLLKNIKHLGKETVSQIVDFAFIKPMPGGKKTKEALKFQEMVSSLFIDELGFNGVSLGGPDKPDTILWAGNHGIIIDSKSYSDGFILDAHCKDEMNGYVSDYNRKHMLNKWWQLFPEGVNNIAFLFVTSYTKGNIEDNIISLVLSCNEDGGVIGVENLLMYADSIKSGSKTNDDFVDDVYRCAFVS